jgi:hypothetical protein
MGTMLACSFVIAFGSGGCAQGARRPMPEPPYVLMYGFADKMLPNWADTLNRVNIITGQTEDAELVKDLRARGILFAYHVNAAKAPGRETPEELAAYWCAALENDLGGKLPGGFDGIAIDEIGSADGTDESKRICEALRLARERCPDRRILVWGGWRMGHGGGGSRYVDANTTYDNELRTVYENCDLLLYEEYIREGNPQFYLFRPSAENLERRVPGMLSKTIYGLYISQNKPFVGDDSDAYDFKDFLDEQFHLLTNDPVLKQTPGVAFWPFYRARADTIAHVNELVRHYYQEGRTNYYGDGDYKQMVQNPGFEAEGAWDLRPGEGGTVQIADYAACPGVADRHEPVSHGKRCLRMERGTAANVASQTLKLRPQTWYTLTAYCFLPSGGDPPETRALSEAGKPLETQRGLTKWDEWLTPVITFRTDETGDTIIALTDEPPAQGTVSYWDFVEIEECRGINRPTVLSKAARDEGELSLLLEGDNFMPGSTLQVDDREPAPIHWDSPTRAWAPLPDGVGAGTHELLLRKPNWCLHPHQARLEAEF